MVTKLIKKNLNKIIKALEGKCNCRLPIQIPLARPDSLGVAEVIACALQQKGFDVDWVP